MKDVTAELKGKLKPNERAFEVDSGEGDPQGGGRPMRAAVEVTRGEIDGDFLPIRIEARRLDDDGATAALNGVPVRVPPRYLTLSVAALGEGKIDVETIIAENTVQAVDRVKKHGVALAAWFRVPHAAEADADANADRGRGPAKTITHPGQ